MDLNPEGSVEIDSRKTAILDQPRFRAVLPGMAAIVLVGLVIGVGAPLWVALAAGVLPVIVGAWDAGRRDQARLVVWKELTENVCALDARPLAVPAEPGWREVVADWNRDWPVVCESIVQVQRLRERTRALPQRVEQSLGSIVAAADRQEEAVEETASLVANMRQTMTSIGQQVELLLSSSDESASSILELGSSIDEVANNTASMHQVVEASTSSVHEMGASIRQVADGAEQVQEMAESTAASVTEMDRSVQEVSSNAIEAASLTERAHEGASAGRDAVRATISDIERISALTSQAMDRLGGLVSRISQIGGILSAIDEINDETNLLSLNAAIIAAQAGEHGKAFLVVAGHVKTLARRTAGSTRDIEKLIGAIEQESAEAVQAMEAGIKAVATGVDRSRDAGQALELIQQSCSEASERVAEIARATTEQSRNSKGVAEATTRTSTQIQQISQAIAEQKRASETMLESAESSLESCQLVHRSTDEQRETSRHITAAMGQISEMIREIGNQTRIHSVASESVSSAVMVLLDNAQASTVGVGPLREMVADLDQRAASSEWPIATASGLSPATDSGSEARYESDHDRESQGLS